MNPWPGDNISGSAAGQNDRTRNESAFNYAGSGTTIDPSAAFLSPASIIPQGLTPSQQQQQTQQQVQQQQQQQQQRLYNGAITGDATATTNPAFRAPAPVIPSKRPRPEDAMAMASGMTMPAMPGAMPPHMDLNMSPRPLNMPSPSMPFPGVGDTAVPPQAAANGRVTQFPDPSGRIAGQSTTSQPSSPFPRRSDSRNNNVNRMPGATGQNPQMRMANASPFPPATMPAFAGHLQGMPSAMAGGMNTVPNAGRTNALHPNMPQGAPMQSGAASYGVSPGMQASQYIPGMGAAAGANLAGPMTPGTFQGLTPQQRQQRLYQMQLANQSTQMGNATRSLGAGGPAGSMGNAPNMAGVAMTPQLGANAGSGSNMMGIGSPAGMGPVSSQLQPAMGSQQAPGALRQPRQMSPSSAPQYHNPEYFVRMLQQFMRARGQYLNPQPVICGRPVELLHLFNAAMRLGGSKRLTTMGGWPMVAGHLGFPPAQHQAAAAELQNAFARNLLQYEVAVRSRRKQVESQDLRQQAVQTQMAQQQQSDSTGKPQHNAQRQSAQQQMPQQQTASPARPAFSPPPPSNASQQYQGQGPATPSMRESPVPPPATVTARTPSMKGRETNEPAQQLQGPARRASVPRSEASAASAYANGRPQQVADSAFTMLQPSLAADRPSPANADHTPSRSGLTATMPSQAQPSSVLAPPSSEVAEYANRKVLQQPFKPSVISDSVTHGPINVDDIYALGEEISRLRPSAPHFMELGIIDIHALTMGLRSGLHAEVRLALDTLATVTSEPNVHLMLDECPELVDALIECGEEEVQVLAANAPGTGVPAESMTLAPYEEVLATAQYELLSLKPSNEFSSLSHDLDRSVDRLICVTSVLRNLSFAEHNFAILSSPPVVKFIATTVHAMATRHELLRTSRDTLDVMKDLIVLLSNVAHMIAIPGREEALCLLAFLLAFAPAISDAETSNLIGDHGLAGNEEPVSENYTAEPECTDANLAASLSQPLSFQPFDPSVHRYLPLAVDTLAKLLARDDPNRTLYKAIFAQDSAAFSAALAHRTQYPSGACDLMSRTFGLATCSLPSPAQASLLAAPHLLMMLDVRKPMIMQSMLAADVITSMLSSVAGGSGAPAEVSRMARAWLNRADGWAPVLGRVIALLLDIMDKATAMAKHPNRSSPMFAQQTQAATDDANISILRRGLTILRRLATHAEAKPSTRSATTEPGPLVAGDDATLAADTGMAIDDPGSLKTAASLPANRFSLPASVFLRRERVLAALLDPHVDAQILKDICDFSKHGTV